MEHSEVRGGIPTRPVAIITAGLLTLAGGVVMWDSLRLGAGWESDGPAAGYFPFYVGLLLALSSLATLVQAFLQGREVTFVGRAELRQVMAMAWPCAAFVALIGLLGIYLAGALFIGYFMGRYGRYPLHVTVPIAIGIPVLLFMTFEIWFLVPLPKGPIETWLNY